MRKTLKSFSLTLVFILLSFLLIVIIKMSFLGKKINSEKITPYILSSTHQKNVKLTYLGTACFVIDYKGKQFINDPFFSNPSLFSTLIGRMKQTPLSDLYAAPLIKNVSMISISHGHYDHCFDLAQVNQNQATLVADKSTLFQLNEEIKNNSSKIALDSNYYFKWIYSQDSCFRILPLPSTHNPHFANVTLFKGSYTKPQPQLPRYLTQWKLGKTSYSFIVDVLDADTIVFRMAFLGGKISNENYMHLSKICNERNCDIMTTVFWKTKLNAPTLQSSISSTKASIVILNHWNNFFRKNTKPIQELRSSKLDIELKKLNEENMPVRVMLPYTTVEL